MVIENKTFEYKVRDRLKEEGWLVAKITDSKRVADLVAIRTSKTCPYNREVALVKCSTRKKPFREVKKILNLCNKLNITPCLAVKGSKIPIIWFWGEESILGVYKKLKKL